MTYRLCRQQFLSNDRRDSLCQFLLQMLSIALKTKAKYVKVQMSLRVSESDPGKRQFPAVNYYLFHRYPHSKWLILAQLRLRNRKQALDLALSLIESLGATPMTESQYFVKAIVE
ncbi:MAG: hypothetical protein ACI9FB_001541 [Candidatus Azotimanducaceae bacterium]|jgi:hypothetical protein